MNKRIKKLWIDALRSDEYQQGARRLRVGDAYCCLGVLCDLHAREMTDQWAIVADGDQEYRTYLGSDCVLPRVVMEWAGLESANGELGHGSSLAYYNDSGHDFHFIADKIEQHF